MSDSRYWTRRIGRRRALKAAGLGATGLAGAALIGCGEDEPAPATPASTATQAPGATGTATTTPDDAGGILAPMNDTSAEAVPGGIYKGHYLRDVTSLDPLAAESFTANYITRWVYPQLVGFLPGLNGEEATGEVGPQLAESWEFPEPTKLVLKLRDNAKWEERSPTNSRPVDAEDVVFSWQKFKEKSISRKSLANEADPGAPVLDITAIDDHTVQVETAFPFGPLLGSLAYSRWLQIMPRESEGGFDPRDDTRGAGPWVMSKYDRSLRYEFRKNPNYWESDRPFLDGFDLPILEEYAQQLAQFRAGKIYGGVVGSHQEDVIPTKEEIPELNVTRGSFGRVLYQLYFGLKPDSPFRDERVRQAASMMLNRDQILNAFFRLDAFRDAGWPTEVRWHSIGVASGYDAFWVDPQDEAAMGPGAKSFAFDPDEAARLLQAAGHDKIRTKFQFINTPQYGVTFPQVGEAYMGLLQATGLFELEQANPDYSTEYLPKVYFSQGDFDGIAWGASTTYPHVVQHLKDYYHSNGARQKVAYQGDASSIEGQADSDALIEQAMQTVDFEEQVDLIQRWQRENAVRMPMIGSPWDYWAVPGFGLTWPWVKNYGVFRDYLEQPEQTVYPHWWIDEAKRQELTG